MKRAATLGIECVELRMAVFVAGGAGTSAMWEAFGWFAGACLVGVLGSGVAVKLDR